MRLFGFCYFTVRAFEVNLRDVFKSSSSDCIGGFLTGAGGGLVFVELDGPAVETLSPDEELPIFSDLIRCELRQKRVQNVRRVQ
jgi:hypothetical protein